MGKCPPGELSGYVVRDTVYEDVLFSAFFQVSTGIVHANVREIDGCCQVLDTINAHTNQATPVYGGFGALSVMEDARNTRSQEMDENGALWDLVPMPSESHFRDLAMEVSTISSRPMLG